MYLCMYVCMHVCIYACMQLCMHVCMYVHMYTVRMYSHQIPEPVEDHSSYHREPVPIGQYKRMDVQKVGRYVYTYVRM